jgi:hypothetical protein
MALNTTTLNLGLSNLQYAYHSKRLLRDLVYLANAESDMLRLQIQDNVEKAMQITDTALQVCSNVPDK